MSATFKTAEDYIKQIIKVSTALKENIDRGDFRQAKEFLELILRFELSAFNKVKEETNSEVLLQQCLSIRASVEDALTDFEGYENNTKIKNVINKIINSGIKYLESEERFVGYSIEEFNKSSVAKQGKFLSDLIKGITFAQAVRLLGLCFEAGLDIVIGGSSFKDFKIGGDLDVGFKINESFKNKISYSDLKNTVRTVVNKINRQCFREYLSSGQALVQHKWIHDKSILNGVPNIDTVEEFFMRTGFRSDFKCLDKDGLPFGPSGYAVFYIEGKIVLVMPKIKKTSVGEVKFW